MSDTNFGLKPPPQFTTNSEGKPTTVTLETAAYIALLIKANLTDVALWPPGMQEGGKCLARIREIEDECIFHYGQFDRESLPEEVQDEYDRLCLLLDELQDTGEEVTLEEYQAKREENQV